jgi:pyruvate-ferredoxin/flavodoxin oxidoreductase
MKPSRMVTLDGNEAAADVAYRASEVISIYPITPSSSMGELADEWSVGHRKNLWGAVPAVVEMQSEGGVAGAVHGALQGGALATTFTSSQGLLLMLPNMYKIAGELTSFCMHVAARTVATHALSIFGDHSDVMACRQTGFAMLASGSVQEAQDFACIAHAATLESRIPFLHFFDGFRTSHEMAKIDRLSDGELEKMLDPSSIAAHRSRALSPDRPVLRGSAQNPDAFFQAREACNNYYEAVPDVVQKAMDRFGKITGREYGLFEYVGHPDAERVIVMMGSGAETVHETVEFLVERGEKIGLIKIRLFRPFSVAGFLRCLPESVKSIAVLDRTKEPGSVGEPLYLEIVASLQEGPARKSDPVVIGGRYGLSSKEFTPAMVKAVFEELNAGNPRRHFTVGIVDDVSHTSLKVEEDFDIEPADMTRAIFFGLGSDGTVGANKNSVKIIGERTDNWAQGYFVYDSKKAGATTVSHLRFGPRLIRSAYLIGKAGFVACHQPKFLDSVDVLGHAAPGATLLLNSPHRPDQLWEQLPLEVQEEILQKEIKIFVIDAYKVAAEAKLGRRINTVMQACFFGISGVLPRKEAISEIKEAITRTYGKKGHELVERNHAAVDDALRHLHPVEIPARATAVRKRPAPVSEAAPDFVRRVTGVMLAGKGDLLPVSAFPVDGTWPVGTSRWEKRSIAAEIPVWDPAICIQCNKCVMVCPHAAIRAKVYAPEALKGAPDTFKSSHYRAHDAFEGSDYTLQVAPEDCTGCSLCVVVCPAKDKSNVKHKAIDMEPQPPLRAAERTNYEFFLNLPDPDRTLVKPDVKGSQFLQPLFEYSGACAGCGETPYIKLLTQLFGDRALIANATGCSSIYGGNLPTTPYTVNDDGRGPAWSNSLFEDNAEFGLGMRLAVDSLGTQARAQVARLTGIIGEELAAEILSASQKTESEIAAQRGRVLQLQAALKGANDPAAVGLSQIAEHLVRKSVWIVGGDGWAYDIGYGGLDHVLSLGKDVNILVLDTEVYSNTGGQASKATPMGAAAKFAAAGKSSPKKDLGMLAMAYGHVYVARIAFGAKDAQTLKAFNEAESFDGPSVLIAYSPCIAHGYDLALGTRQQKLAVDTGHWPLYRYDPRLRDSGKNPLQLDSAVPKVALERFAENELRFRMIKQRDPERYRRLMNAAQSDATRRAEFLRELSSQQDAKKESEPLQPASMSR